MEDTRKYQAIRKLAVETKEENKEEEKTYIDASDDEFGLMLNCAVRYAMGRETYMPHAVMDFITPLLSKLTVKTLACMNRDLNQPELFGGLGHEKIDAPRWIEFHTAVKYELERRGERSDL